MANSENVNKKKLSRRALIWIVVGGVVLLLIGLYIFDFALSKSYVINIKAAPDVAVAGDASGVEFEVLLTNKNGKPISGHNLFAMADGNGRFLAYRLTTDSSGKAIFNFYVGASTIFTPAEDINITIYDESNSIFLMVSAKATFKLTVIDGE